ncbi:hypothetical protein ES705_00634 [subsurface metagenome]|nr:hypothetical protein [Clostridia bacterium]
MIKKYKSIKMVLPPIQITIGDVSNILNKIKKNRLGSINSYNEKDEKINIKKINKEVIYNLLIEVSAKDKKDNFKIIFGKKESSIQYYNEIDPDKLLKIIEIEELISNKKVFNITKKISSNLGIINSVILMIYLSLSPIIKNINYDNIWIKIGIICYAVLAFTFLFLDTSGNTRIIININNRFKKFYYRYFSIINLLRAFVTSALFIFILFLVYYFLNGKFNT